METLAANSPSSPLLATMVLLTNWRLAHTAGESSATSSYFRLISTANSINPTSVSIAYVITSSVRHCGLRCSKIMAPSFYFVGKTSTCYCSNHHDPDTEEATGAGSITYGILRQGNSSQCQAIYDTGARDDGVYNDSNGEQMFCNLTALGWIVFQRRQDGSVDFNRTWTDYVNGFGDPEGEFWLGLDALHQATQNGCELLIYLEAEPNNTVQDKGFARYSSFSVSDSTDNYRLHVGGYTGNGLGDSLLLHDGHMFSTHGDDNDSNGNRNCALFYGGGWWFNDCLEVNLNGAYLGGNHELFGNGIVWYSWRGYYYSLLHTEMAYRC